MGGGRGGFGVGGGVGWPTSLMVPNREWGHWADPSRAEKGWGRHWSSVKLL